MLGIVFDTREGKGVFLLVRWVSFSIPERTKGCSLGALGIVFDTLGAEGGGIFVLGTIFRTHKGGEG